MFYSQICTSPRNRGSGSRILVTLMYITITNINIAARYLSTWSVVTSWEHFQESFAIFAMDVMPR